MSTKVSKANGTLHAAGRMNGAHETTGQSLNRRHGADDSEMLLVSQEILRLVESSREGRLSDRGQEAQFSGVYREMIQGVNTMLDAILLPIGEGNRVLAQISAGKIDELITQTYKATTRG